MKKLFMLFAATYFFAVITNAQTNAVSVRNDLASLIQQENAIKREKRNDKKELAVLKAKEVSAGLKHQFYRDFDNVEVKQWERSLNFDEVTFIKDRQVFTAFYDDDTKLIGISSEKTFADLPQKAKDYIIEKYKDYSIGDVIFFDDNESNETDMILYNQAFDDADNYFVELKKENKKIVLEVNIQGEVSYFARLK